MKIDILLPLSLFLIVALSLLLNEKIGRRVRGILGDRKLGGHEIFLMVASVGAMVSLTVLMPSYAIQIIFVAAYSYMLLIFVYLLLEKILLAVIPPVAFIITYLAVYIIIEDAYIANAIMSLFAALFAIMIITYLNALFSWRVAILFAALLTAMDVIQVFLTTHMIEAAFKMIALRLPVAIILPTFPSVGYMMSLGLGDIFLSGLLSTQAANRYGRKTGLLIAASISAALFIFEILAFNLKLEFEGGFPATIIVLLGCFLGLGISILQKRISERKW
ncbi:MAG: hypothetical protein QW502_02230 [Candidatus Bathyarchaeia archaeon]|nr:hypothetical protein [Candidatus Bathyarchaeota archaeon]